MRRTTQVGISLPDELLSVIDGARGDVSRSRYVLRLLELALAQAGGDAS